MVRLSRIDNILRDLKNDVSAKFVLVVNERGERIARAGDPNLEIDASALAGLTAGNVAATDGLSKLLGEKECSILFREGEGDNVHILVLNHRRILVVIFDERSSLGKVRLGTRGAAQELLRLPPDDDPSSTPSSGNNGDGGPEEPPGGAVAWLRPKG